MDPRKFETFIYLVMHPALLTIAIVHFSDQTWIPWVLVIPYAFFAYITWPGLKPSTEAGLFWFFGRPFISAIAGYLMLKANGMPDHLSVVALSFATFSIYIFSNVIALLARMTPVLVTTPQLHYAARRNPVGLAILSGLAFMIVYQILSWLQMALG
ncbi:MAG: hypothetical protein Q4G24_05160 [Paracoccus sp. (in: a-proteobacteria)]|uniref:hypothetical protein n=1 Tax=Paracoccus sp. TaxID=267 RepID=UPI0026DED9CE|nr:hypothetical protein [Paracoccus sp. (in: a-proteobacteria)]MDO5620840.1 hypothetical protein [Paracoccus sp. (in: a-proteobacteria)]